MITILSPAKKLLNFEHPYRGMSSNPQFPEQTKSLVDIMKTKTQSQIASLMGLSAELSRLNYERYQAYNTETMPDVSAYPAIHFFQGDVYQTLEAQHWSEDTMVFAQSHLLVLSGLYGLLRPLDLIQPYRLEMGTRLSNPRGNNLYDFWGDIVTNAINQQLSHDDNPTLINLASNEYASVVKMEKIDYPCLSITFKEEKDGKQKVIGIHAKKARGAMARFIMTEQIESIDRLSSFSQRGYEFDETQSHDHELVFVCRHV